MAPPSPCYHLPSAGELQQQMRATDEGTPFLVYRDRGCEAGEGERCQQHLFQLRDTRDRVTVGRTPAADLSLSGDRYVSRAHCVLERVGSGWVLVDDGLSRHGSFVRERDPDSPGGGKELRVHGRRRLSHGDELRLGKTKLVYHAPLAASESTTWVSGARTVELPEAPRRVLVALCRPYRSRDPFATPATNQQIASELFLAVETVKAHLRVLFDRLGVEKDVPQHHKRIRLVERAFQLGVISLPDLDEPEKPPAAAAHTNAP
jgi:predicted component of type VI protein secretion system